MKVRINAAEKGKKAMEAVLGMGRYVWQSRLEKKLVNLVLMRASQVNRCAMCLDIHSKDMLAEGEDPQRLFLLDAWRDAPFYSDRERAALAFTEALTSIEKSDLPEPLHEELRAHFSDEELIDLTMAVITINSYNRINHAFGADVGSYRVGQYQ